MRGFEEIEEKYRELFGRPATLRAWAPGRVNLIGEHTDYNEGFVLPLAVDRGIRFAGNARDDRKVLLYSLDYEDSCEFFLDHLTSDPAHRWADYFKGVADQLQKRGITLRGCEAAFGGDLPRGAGLSSSAALEVASAVFLRQASGFSLGDLDMVRVAQDAENQFVGVRCGIMDMYASYLCRGGCALKIDCRDLSSRPASLPPGLQVVVCDTGVERSLASSAYNQRRSECEEGVRRLSAALPGLRSLRDVSPDDFFRHERLLPEPVRLRVRHVVTENARVLKAVAALEKGELEALGRLMGESHASLRDDYQVSCPELDALVRLAQDTPGVVGTRMTGAGFGGCTVALAREGYAEGLVRAVEDGYHPPRGGRARVWVFRAAPGAKESLERD